ncbi:MAG: Formamidopyrimidine-DNA glycosylase [Fimbriimonadaceae bacterium]|nr:Formamidopyrimidine-DNA glycosylase [Fimbriimonadaceae bacterium]
MLRRTMVGKTIAAAEVAPDEIVLEGRSPAEVEAALVGRKVSAIGRKGKFFWLEFDGPPIVCAHLGMAGWFRELGAPTIRLKEHGKAPLDDENGRPRFLKLLLQADDGVRAAMTDGRRLSRIWLAESSAADPRVAKLGPDAYDQLPSVDALVQMLKGRTAPIKALLLDQGLFAGVGNWLADEALYHARISPKREGGSLKKAELARLREALTDVLAVAVEAGADEHKYPEDWMFHHRWGGAKGPDLLLGKPIRRETVGGRTTAWVPGLQK